MDMDSDPVDGDAPDSLTVNGDAGSFRPSEPPPSPSMLLRRPHATHPWAEPGSPQRQAAERNLQRYFSTEDDGFYAFAHVDMQGSCLPDAVSVLANQRGGFETISKADVRVQIAAEVRRRAQRGDSIHFPGFPCEPVLCSEELAADILQPRGRLEYTELQLAATLFRFAILCFTPLPDVGDPGYDEAVAKPHRIKQAPGNGTEAASAGSNGIAPAVMLNGDVTDQAGGGEHKEDGDDEEDGDGDDATAAAAALQPDGAPLLFYPETLRLGTHTSAGVVVFIPTSEGGHFQPVKVDGRFLHKYEWHGERAQNIRREAAQIRLMGGVVKKATGPLTHPHPTDPEVAALYAHRNDEDFDDHHLIRTTSYREAVSDACHHDPEGHDHDAGEATVPEDVLAERGTGQRGRQPSVRSQHTDSSSTHHHSPERDTESAGAHGCCGRRRHARHSAFLGELQSTPDCVVCCLDIQVDAGQPGASSTVKTWLLAPCWVLVALMQMPFRLVLGVLSLAFYTVVPAPHGQTACAGALRACWPSSLLPSCLPRTDPLFTPTTTLEQCYALWAVLSATILRKQRTRFAIWFIVVAAVIGMVALPVVDVAECVEHEKQPCHDTLLWFTRLLPFVALVALGAAAVYNGKVQARTLAQLRWQIQRAIFEYRSGVLRTLSASRSQWSCPESTCATSSVVLEAARLGSNDHDVLGQCLLDIRRQAAAVDTVFTQPWEVSLPRAYRQHHPTAQQNNAMPSTLHAVFSEGTLLGLHPHDVAFDVDPEDPLFAGKAPTPQQPMPSGSTTPPMPQTSHRLSTKTEWMELRGDWVRIQVEHAAWRLRALDLCLLRLFAAAGAVAAAVLGLTEPEYVPVAAIVMAVAAALSAGEDTANKIALARRTDRLLEQLHQTHLLSALPGIVPELVDKTEAHLASCNDIWDSPSLFGWL